VPRYRIHTSLRQPFPGGRQSRRAGESLDFLELRGYTPGDDPRFVDWKAYARSGRLYTRVWQGEERARFTIWLDGSPSMQLYGKLAYAREAARLLLAAALPDETFALSPGSLNRLKTAAAAELLKPDPRGPLAALADLGRARGQLILISDGLDEGDWPAFMQRLNQKRPLLIQILAPAELSPPGEAAEWHDVESGEKKPVTAAEVKAYKEALAKHVKLLRQAALTRGGYAHLRVGEPILPALRRQRVLEWR